MMVILTMQRNLHQHSHTNQVQQKKKKVGITVTSKSQEAEDTAIFLSTTDKEKLLGTKNFSANCYHFPVN